MNYPRLNKHSNKKVKQVKRLPYQKALQKFKEVNRENEYIITKGDPVEMQKVRFWTLGDYYSALEQILKDNDRAEQQANKITRKK